MKQQFRIFTLVAVLLATAALWSGELSAQAQNAEKASKTGVAPPPAIPMTSMAFEQEEIDFGTAKEGEIVSRTFTLKNTGTAPLILSGARGSCGCTVPEWPREPIAPGDTASIKVDFNTTHKPGRRSQRVTITANTDPPQTFITLSGEVEPTDHSGHNH